MGPARWEWKCSKFFAYRTVAVVHSTDQNRISKTIVVTMLKQGIVSRMRWSVKLVLETETQKSHSCVRPSLLLTYCRYLL